MRGLSEALTAMTPRKKRAKRKAASKTKPSQRRNPKTETGTILDLRGIGKGLWEGEHPDEYVRRLREGWE